MRLTRRHARRHALLALTALLAACDPVVGSGTMATETRQIDHDFDGVIVEGGVRADVVAGRIQRVTLTADDNLLPLIWTRVEDRSLNVEPSEAVEPMTPIELSVDTSTVAFVSAREPGSVIVAYGVEADRLGIAASNGAYAQADGRCATLTAIASDSAALFAPELDCVDAVVHAQGGARVTIRASGRVEVNASGESEVVIHGSPVEIVEYLTDGSSITRMP